MLTKSQEKYINSLRIKKYRKEYKVFIAEGEKLAEEILQSSFSIQQIVATWQWIDKYAAKVKQRDFEITEVSEPEMSKISELKSPSSVLIIASIPEWKIDEEELQSNLSLILEQIQDPGNMGTIIRIADWFGIPNIFCSEDCADVFNPKTVQSTMGSVTHVKVFETDLIELLKKYSSLPSYAAVLDGKDLFNEHLSSGGFILIGNESKGLSDPLLQLSKVKLSIPAYGKAESLNAAIAAGIICAQFRAAKR